MVKIVPGHILALVVASALLLIPGSGQCSHPSSSPKFDATFRKYQELSSDPRGTRDQWLRVIHSFAEIHHKAGRSETGKRSLFFAGRSCLSLYRRSGNRADLDQAIRHLNAFVRMHRSGPYLILGLQELKEAHLLKRRLVAAHGKQVFQKPGARTTGRTAGRAGPDRQRVGSAQACISKRPVPAPDLTGTVQSSVAQNHAVPKTVEPQQPLATQPLVSTESGTHSPTDPGTGIQVFSRVPNHSQSMESEFNCTGNPFFHGPRVIPEKQPPPVRNASLPPVIMNDAPRPLKAEPEEPPAVAPVLPEKQSADAPIEESKPQAKPAEPEPADATKQDAAPAPPCVVSGEKYVVVIDPGHGGKDPGAVSNDGQLREKEVTLKIADRVKERLEKNYPGITVALTRKEDTFLPLQERTACANSLNADLFVSIHCNAAEDASSRGIETYYLSKASSRKAMASAARENGIPPDRMSDIDATLLDLLMDSKKNESVRLAETVHHSLIRTVKGANSLKRDRGVKRAPFYVLLGAKMPAVLVECGFINGRERDKLKQPSYLDSLATGISDGIGTYLQGLGDKT